MLRHNVTRGLSCPCSLRNWESLTTINHLDYFWIMSLGRAARSVQFTSVQFSRSVMSDSLQPPGLQHIRPPCPSPNPRVTHTHIHWVGDGIQPFHPLSSPSPPSFNLSQHQGLLIWVSSSHQVAKVLEFQLQHQYFQWFTLDWTRWIPFHSKGLSSVFSITRVWKHQFFGAQLSL